MANIFSGIFAGNNNSGNQAAKLAQYKDQLEQDAKLREYQQRNQDVMAQSGAFDTAIQNMSPERQNQMRLFQMMQGGMTTGDKGLEAANKSFGQRGGLMADIAKDSEALKNDKALWDYKLKNPQPGSHKDIEYAEYMENLHKNDPEAYERALIAKRQEQYLDTGTSLVSTVTGDIVTKNLIQKGVDEARAPIIAEELGSFYSDMDNTAHTLAATYNQRTRIKELFDMTDNTTAGWAGLFNWVPGMGPKEWDAKKQEILANVGLDKILELKDSSAQGATGLGALNEKELEMLQSYLGRIEQSRDPAGLKKTLNNMDRWMGRLMEKRQSEARRRRRSYNEHKSLIGYGPSGTPDEIPDYQEKIFADAPYVPDPVESPLDDNSLESIQNKYNLEVTPDESS